MSITLTEYPVITEAGKVLNTFAGFKPIELEFAADGGETAIECVLVDPDDENVDLLGFSLYVDFDPNGVAVVDVSIINDKNSQSVLLESQTVTDSRIKYQVKYREAGTTGSYTLIDGLIPPIIAVYSIKQFDLDKWLTPEIEPNLWLGYPAMSGFVHSDSNEVGLDMVVRYDLLDIQKNVLSADNLLFNYGSTEFGVYVANFITGGSGSEIPLPNAGATGETDWINPTDGVAEDWEKGSVLYEIASIVTGNGFTGNAQRIESTNINNRPKLARDNIDNIGVAPALIRIKYRANALLFITPNVLNPGVSFAAPTNTSDAIIFETSAFIPFNGQLLILFSTPDGLGNYLEVDEVEVFRGASFNSEFVDFKIISE